MSIANSTITANRSFEISYNILPNNGQIVDNKAGRIIKNIGGYIASNILSGDIESNSTNNGGIINNTGGMDIKKNRTFEGIFGNQYVGDPPIRQEIKGIIDNTSRYIRNNIMDDHILWNTLCGPIQDNGYIDGVTIGPVGPIRSNNIYGRIDTDATRGSKIENNPLDSIINNTCQGIIYNY